MQLCAAGGISSVEVLLRRLRTLADLSGIESHIAAGLGPAMQHHRAGGELAGHGRVAHRPQCVVSGWACRQHLLPDGRRQIYALILPGDCIDVVLPRRTLRLAAVVALTAVQTLEAGSLRACRDEPWPALAPALSKALDASAAEEAALIETHMLRLGRMTALERTAHLLLELRDRLARVGLVQGARVPLPVTQDTLADLLGLSAVHLNRTLQQLRRERLIELRAGVAVLLEPERLARIADYESCLVDPEPTLEATLAPLRQRLAASDPRLA